MSYDATGTDVPLDPRQDWRTRLPVPGTRPPADQPSTPRPIDAPAPPQQLKAPHNLFTLEEITAALRLLSVGLSADRPARVLVTHRQGGDDSLALDEFEGITYAEDVTSISVFWTYLDGSRVAGDLVDRPDAGALAVQGGGLALAATRACIDQLRTLRPQRARARAWGASRRPEAVFVLLYTAAYFAFLTWVVRTDGAGSDADALLRIPLTTGVLVAAVVTVVLSAVAMQLMQLPFARARRRIGGTRLAPVSQVTSTVLTPELGVLAAVAGVPIALASLAIAVIALLVSL